MTYAGSEIVEIAVQIEINGRDFYSAVSAKAKNKTAKEMFRFLAGEESEHAKTFREMLGKIKKYEPEEAYPEEYFSYMRSLADNKVFTGKNSGIKAAESAANEKDAIDTGIAAERYSIEFYEGMKKLVPENDKSVIDKVIAEETNHLDKLTGLKEGL